jgi:hypothetical protein
MVRRSNETTGDRKLNNEKGVILMNYSKPEIARLAEAAVAICSEDSLSKTIVGSDLTNPDWQMPAAYVAEE